MLELLKGILNITDNSKDTILNHYLDTSKLSIQSHLNYKEDEMEGLFQVQIVNLAKYLYKNKDVVGVSQQSQGSRSMSMEKGLPQEIKDSLPLPRVRIVGGR